MGEENGMDFILESDQFELLDKSEIGLVENDSDVWEEEETEMGGIQEYEEEDYEHEYLNALIGEEEMLDKERYAEDDMEWEGEGEGEEGELYQAIVKDIAIPLSLKRDDTKRRQEEDDVVFEMMSRAISGDFKTITYPLKPLLMEDMFEEEVVQEQIFIGPSEYKPLPTGISDYREKLMERCINLQQHKLELLVRHTMLQTELAKYYKNRRMEFCLREVGDTSELEFKYNKMLEKYASFLRVRKIQQENLTTQLENLAKIKEIKEINSENALNDFHNYLAQVGRGLIYSKTGSTLSNGMIDRCLHRRKLMTARVSKLRYELILHNNMVAQREDDLHRLEKLDELGDSYYTLGYFEKLKSENRGYHDRIEEKQADLVQICKVLHKTVLISSHMKEKSAGLAQDIMDSRWLQNELKYFIKNTRCQLILLKRERDEYRSKTLAKKNESGLLLHTDLLKDFEQAQNQRGILQKEFDVLKAESVKVVQQIRNARKTREALIEMKRKGNAGGSRRPSNWTPKDKELARSSSRDLVNESKLSKELKVSVKKMEVNN